MSRRRVSFPAVRKPSPVAKGRENQGVIPLVKARLINLAAPVKKRRIAIQGPTAGRGLEGEKR